MCIERNLLNVQAKAHHRQALPGLPGPVAGRHHPQGSNQDPAGQGWPQGNSRAVLKAWLTLGSCV